jgi:hypothetical protein
MTPDPAALSASPDLAEKEDLFLLKPGVRDDLLEKTIDEVVMTSDEFIVYLATDLSIQWRMTDEHMWRPEIGSALNTAAKLEARSKFISDAPTLRGVRRQIAEGLARSFEGPDNSVAVVALREVENEIKARNKEVSWSWYFTAAYAVTLTSLVFVVCSWLARDTLRAHIGAQAFEVLLGTLLGAVGALISATSRGNRLHLDANAGHKIHTLEGLLRIAAGMVGAAFAALAFKGGVLFGGVHFAGSQFALLLTLCIAAGASERLVPDLLGKLDRQAKDARAAGRTPPEFETLKPRVRKQQRQSVK